jgi:hypothetical protein
LWKEVAMLSLLLELFENKPELLVETGFEPIEGGR